MLIQLIIVQVIVFVIIIVFLKKLLYTETEKETGRLKTLKNEFSAKEKELQVKIEAAQSQAAEKIAKAEEDARKYMEAKEKEADEVKQELLLKARNQASDIVKAAVNAKSKIREEIELDIKKDVPGAAVRIIREALSPATIELIHNELVEEVIDRIKTLDKGMFTMASDRGELLSPYPVKNPKKEKIVSAISEKTGHTVSLVDKDSEGLVAGIIVKLGALMIDGSLENKLRQVRMRE